MSRDMAVLAQRASKAARSAHNDFRALYQAVGSRLDAPLLAAVGTDLDGLAMKLTSLSISTAALSSSLAHDMFETRMSDDVTLSHGITYDMKAIGRRLRSLKPSNSSEQEMIMGEREGENMLNMIKRYDGAVSAILSYHQLSSADAASSDRNVMMNDLSEIRDRLKETQDSEAEGLRIKVHAKLLPLTSATYNSKDARPGCFENTRVALQQQLSDWANDDAHELVTLWLKGMAGTGKSAISATFAHSMADEGLLGATFFVDRLFAERTDIHRIVQSLAYDLAEGDHNRLRALWTALRAKPTIKEMPLRDQVQTLIKRPLDATYTETLVIVIDGLDQCALSDGALLVSTLVDCLKGFPIKLFVASRESPAIVEAFSRIKPTEIRLQLRPEEEVSDDVRRNGEADPTDLIGEVAPRPVLPHRVDLRGTAPFTFNPSKLGSVKPTLGSPEGFELCAQDLKTIFGIEDQYFGKVPRRIITPVLQGEWFKENWYSVRGFLYILEPQSWVPVIRHGKTIATSSFEPTYTGQEETVKEDKFNTGTSAELKIEGGGTYFGATSNIKSNRSLSFRYSNTAAIQKKLETAGTSDSTHIHQLFVYPVLRCKVIKRQRIDYTINNSSKELKWTPESYNSGYWDARWVADSRIQEIRKLILHPVPMDGNGLGHKAHMLPIPTVTADGELEVTTIMSRKGWIDWYHYDIPWETEKDFGEETIDLAAPDNDVAFRPMSTWTTLPPLVS